MQGSSAGLFSGLEAMWGPQGPCAQERELSIMNALPLGMDGEGGPPTHERNRSGALGSGERLRWPLIPKDAWKAAWEGPLKLRWKGSVFFKGRFN